ncbi:hypothetical protein RHGRI_001656 [Rhododendron griersonianum]|uniref:Uncharacterized protein n=1 Tax=Rhododendron griersonianum TaxID=479676 RepID=A0AAV6LNJ8_9ERIC|nr:hypothetical protein RHGRI_001656 [Rhododendron griersonianum]
MKQREAKLGRFLDNKPYVQQEGEQKNKSKKMTAEVANGVAEPLSYPNGGIMHQNPSNAAVKKSRETERHWQRKQKKNNNKASQQQR